MSTRAMGPNQLKAFVGLSDCACKTRPSKGKGCAVSLQERDQISKLSLALSNLLKALMLFSIKKYIDRLHADLDFDSAP